MTRSLARACQWLRRRPFAAIIPLVLLLAALDLWSRPPAMPSYAETRDGWRASEAWLRDRHGRLIQTVRIDFAVRRLEWVPLARISPAVLGAVVAAEDRRFPSHKGVDWRGLGGS